jgi:hypothetical protein
VENDALVLGVLTSNQPLLDLDAAALHSRAHMLHAAAELLERRLLTDEGTARLGDLLQERYLVPLRDRMRAAHGSTQSDPHARLCVEQLASPLLRCATALACCPAGARRLRGSVLRLLFSFRVSLRLFAPSPAHAALTARWESLVSSLLGTELQESGELAAHLATELSLEAAGLVARFSTDGQGGVSRAVLPHEARTVGEEVASLLRCCCDSPLVVRAVRAECVRALRSESELRAAVRSTDAAPHLLVALLALDAVQRTCSTRALLMEGDDALSAEVLLRLLHVCIAVLPADHRLPRAPYTDDASDASATSTDRAAESPLVTVLGRLWHDCLTPFLNLDVSTYVSWDVPQLCAVVRGAGSRADQLRAPLRLVVSTRLLAEQAGEFVTRTSLATATAQGRENYLGVGVEHGENDEAYSSGRRVDEIECAAVPMCCVWGAREQEMRCRVHSEAEWRRSTALRRAGNMERSGISTW